jgi:hypothetical protein
MRTWREDCCARRDQTFARGEDALRAARRARLDDQENAASQRPEASYVEGLRIDAIGLERFERRAQTSNLFNRKIASAAIVGLPDCRVLTWIGCDDGPALRKRKKGGEVAGNLAAMRESLATALSLSEGDSARELGHIDIFGHLFAGRSVTALAAIRVHLRTWPRDALVLSLAANQGGLIGMSGLRGRLFGHLNWHLGLFESMR